MSSYRATDEQLDREIATLESIARIRLRRASAELRELDRDLRDLRKERARRAAPSSNLAVTDTPAASEASSSEG